MNEGIVLWRRIKMKMKMKMKIKGGGKIVVVI